MAVTHTLLTEGSSETDGNSYDTASISPSTDKLLLVDISSNPVSAGDNVTPTLSGCGVTWVVVATLVGTGTEGADYARQTMFRAMGTPTTGVLTISFSADQAAIAWSVCEKGNVDTGGTNGSAAVVQSTTALSTTATCTVTLAAFSNVNNATHGAFHREGTATGATQTPGTGFTEESDIEYALGGGFYGYLHTIYRVDNDTTVDSTASDAMDGTSGIVIEIKEAVADTNINAGFDTLAITEYTAKVNAETNVAAGIDTLAITTYNATVSLGVDVGAAVVSLNITTYAASINAETNVQAGVDALSITIYAATITLPSGATNVIANTAVLSITAYAAVIELDVAVAAGFVGLTITPRKATITSGTPITSYELIIGRQMIAYLTDTLFPLDIAVDSSGGVTGLAITVALRDPDDSTSYLDFADGTFKTGGWTTQYQSLDEYGGGFYGTNLDISAITNFPSAKHAAVEFDVTGSVVGVSQGVLSLSQTWLQAQALTVGKFLGLM